MAITLERRSEGTYPFGGFHTSLRSIYRQKMGPKELKSGFLRASDIDDGDMSQNRLIFYVVVGNSALSIRGNFQLDPICF